ncbi:hypothetical protein GGTG_13885 [Gaeumannomyces tritici R3-111a-1]|uniref:Secreted protein n=1 Tax=Gaeumannomyces tritici (strain R3-111a-1) TaxID=644352 RepID=J3PK38_GAET3|nr:hypothetical protein GGTG_13885 [Gaeumannomyces tritici R3-111a-1]EJT68539.1 hypothetical protein GGTG_13885 [Gaeumannomyces tritici R3-111a-1]
MRPTNALILVLACVAASAAVDIQPRQTGGGNACKCLGYPSPGLICGNCVLISNGAYLIREGRVDTHVWVVLSVLQTLARAISRAWFRSTQPADPALAGQNDAEGYALAPSVREGRHVRDEALAL